MPNFFDIQLEKKQSPEEYIRSIHSPMKRMMIEDLFLHANQIIEIARSDAFPRPERPIIRICKTNRFIAESMDGLIEISTGFIDSCLASQSAPLQEIITKLAGDQNIPATTPNPLFSWSIAHEYWHGIRRHNTVLDITPNTHQTLHSIEIDADLCATASLYRWAQSEMSQHYADITIRKVVFASLFWAIRGMPESAEQSTHPSNMERLYHICIKMAHLRKNKHDPADQSLKTAESKGNMIPLIELMIKAERRYKLTNPDCNGDMIAFIELFTENQGWAGFVENWERIHTLVSVTSGTTA